MELAKTAFGDFKVVGYESFYIHYPIEYKPNDGFAYVLFNDGEEGVFLKKEIINWDELPEFVELSEKRKQHRLMCPDYIKKMSAITLEQYIAFLEAKIKILEDLAPISSDGIRIAKEFIMSEVKRLELSIPFNQVKAVEVFMSFDDLLDDEREALIWDCFNKDPNYEFIERAFVAYNYNLRTLYDEELSMAQKCDLIQFLCNRSKDEDYDEINYLIK